MATEFTVPFCSKLLANQIFSVSMNLIFHRLVPGTPRPRFDAAKSERAGLEMDRAGHALFFTLRACAFALFGGAFRAGSAS